jgi:hypothetical protein
MLRKVLLTSAAALVALSVAAVAQTRLNYYQPGPRLINGSQLNLMVDAVNGITGNGTSGNITANAIAAGDSSLGITGQAAQTATAAGGAIVLTGGASGSTSGTGGAVSFVGGASPTSGNGGAVNITGGAATTSGVGGNVVVTAGASAGGSNAGGSINLVPTAAVSTGIPGKVQVNGDACLIPATYYFTGSPAATNQVFFIATRAMIVTNISQVHSTAAGGASTLDVTKDTTTGAPASGTALGQSAFNLNATANTVQNATLSATIATITLAAGDRLAVKYNNTIQSSAGVVVTACMAPL